MQERTLAPGAWINSDVLRRLDCRFVLPRAPGGRIGRLVLRGAPRPGL